MLHNLLNFFRVLALGGRTKGFFRLCLAWGPDTTHLLTKEQIKKQILEMLNGAEPSKTLTPQKTSMFAKIGKSIN